MLEKLHQIVLFWDYTAWYYINTQWHNEVLDAIMPFLRNQWTWAPLYLFLLIFLPLNYGRKGWMWCVFFLLTFAMSDYISATLMKPVFIRPRPCNNPYIKDIVHLIVPCGSGYSFPSSHAANHFALGVFAAISFRKITKWVWLAGIFWGLSVSYAQVYVGVHFPGDVLIGGAIGILIAMLTGYTYNKIYGLHKGKITDVQPTS